MSELLEVEDLRVELPIEGAMQPVVDRVQLAIGEGEALGLVGESGSGKSMTARALIRLLPNGADVSGSVRVDGADVMEMAPTELLTLRATQIATIFQDPRAHINPVRRVGDFLVEALITCRRVPRDEALRTVVTVLRDTGIPDAQRRLRQYPHELSGGLLQRVMIAAALAIQPRLLIADEPTTALDVTTQAELLGMLDEMRRERGLALLFITHDLDLAASVCDRTAVMYAGRIVEIQSSARLHEHPLHPYTAALGRCRPSITGPPLRLQAIAGRPMAAYEAPAGCAFGPRCPFCENHCRETAPSLRVIENAVAACHRTEHIQTRLSEHKSQSALGPAIPGAGTGRDLIVEVTELNKRFKVRQAGAASEFVAVDEVSFSLEAGASLAIVGESGAGKSTVARMLVGLERPSAGEIVICGRKRTFGRARSSERQRRARETQIVFQDPYSSLDPRQRVQAALEEAVNAHFRLTKAELKSRVASLLEKVGLDPRYGKSVPRALSGGQRQRVAIARALAAEPRLLVLDEAVSALDMSIQAQVLNLLADIREQTGTSYVFISHDLAVVRQIAERVIVMRHGRVVEQGVTSDVLDSPKQDYTRILRDSVPQPGWKPERRRTHEPVSAEDVPVKSGLVDA